MSSHLDDDPEKADSAASPGMPEPREPDPKREPASDLSSDLEALQIPDELKAVIEAVEDPMQRATVIRIAEEMSWHGPLPPPPILAQYNDAYEGCAHDLVQMAIANSVHRQSMERTNLTADIKLRSRGQILGGIIALTVIVGAVILIAIDKEIGGLIALLTTLVGVIGLFVYTRREERAEVRENLRQVDGMSPPEE